MNERIKQLAAEAKLEHCVSHVRLQDFAERIIKECHGVIVTCGVDDLDGVMRHFDERKD